MAEDPFDSLLSLEDQYYDEGYKSGFKDGQEAGLAEGRAFGLEKGFEKYKAMGQLRGRSLVWASRLDKGQQNATESSFEQDEIQRSTEGSTPCNEYTLPILPSNSRLAKHIHLLLALTNPSVLSTANSEEAVDDFDERLRRAEAKVQIIAKMIGEGSCLDMQEDHNSTDVHRNDNKGGNGKGGGEGDIEDITTFRTRR